MTITLTFEEAQDLIEDYEVIETEPCRWGTRQRRLFSRDGKHYAFWVRFHSEEGMVDEGDYEAEEVRPVKVTTTKWVV